MGIADHLTCLLRNLYAGQEATGRNRHGKTDLLKIGKGVCQGCILSPCLFNFYSEYIMQNVRLDKSQAGIQIPGRNNKNLRYADDDTLMNSMKRQKYRKLKDELPRSVGTQKRCPLHYNGLE